MFDVSEFISSIPMELARDAHFQMFFTLPSGVSGDVRTLSMLCGASSLPIRQAETTSYRRYGQGLEMQYIIGMQYAPLELTFYCDTKATAITSIQKWMDTMLEIRKTGNLMSVQYKSAYKTQLTLSHFDSVGSVIGEYTFNDAFPIAFGPINFSWASRNSIVLVPATFAYTAYTSSTGAGSSANNLSTSNQPGLSNRIPVTGNIPINN